MSSSLISEPAVQYTLFDPIPQEVITNVASVPQRSPFRYPGGKTWLVPQFRRWMRSLRFRPEHFIEPFAGGGIIGLTAAFENFADQVTLVEYDPDVAAVWETILSGEGLWLGEQIISLPLDLARVEDVLVQVPQTTRERALQTIIRNRLNHGGILAPGSGRLKNGENGKGVWSRWYPETLRKRIMDIDRVRERIRFMQSDALEVIPKTSHHRSTVFFIDPPYTADGKKAGSRLYRYNEIDHHRLFDACDEIRGDFLLTYDDALGVRKLAEQHGFETRLIGMKNTHHSKMTERLIGRDLGWV